MTNRILGLFFLCAAAMSGCAVGPDYKTPATDAGQSFANAGYSEFSEQSMEVAWWKLFEDQELTALVDKTVQHNRDLQAARANLGEARALYMDAGLNLAPTITSEHRAGHVAPFERSSTTQSRPSPDRLERLFFLRAI